MQMIGQQVLYILDGCPWFHREGTLAAVFVVNVLDEEFEIKVVVVIIGRSVG